MNTTHDAINKQTRKQRVYVCLFLFAFVLFTLNSCATFPDTTQTPGQKTATTQSLKVQHTNSKKNVVQHNTTSAHGCSDIVFSELVNGKLLIYFNDCALQHLSAIVASVDAGAAFLGFVSLRCEECVPIAAVIATIAAVVTAGKDFLQYASQGCGGAYLEISWDGGIQFEPACGIQARRS
jgi:hypothetical protein